MRVSAIVIFALLTLALLACSIAAYRSRKPMAKDVSLLTLGLLFPVLGNIIILATGDEFVSYLGSYVSFMGMSFAVAAMLRFSSNYCEFSYKDSLARKVVCCLVLADVIQFLLNPVFGQAFYLTEGVLDNMAFWSLVPLAGQAFHRIIVYGMFFASTGIFVGKIAKTPPLYVEKYAVMLIVMIVTGMWETYYILSGSPIDLSMVGFGLFGICVFYFSLYYKPLRLRDRMLARIVADLDEALFFFDKDRHCFYINEAAFALSHADLDDAKSVESSEEKVKTIIGEELFDMDSEWSYRRTVIREEDGKEMFLVFTYKLIDDKRGRRAASYLRVRDRTEDELHQRAEIYNATHDSLTGLYNKEYLMDKAQKAIEENPSVDYCVAAIDVRDFKLINDVLGKDFGDRILIAIAKAMRENYKPGKVFGRITGDRFAFIMPKDQFVDEFYEHALGSNELAGSRFNHPLVMHMGVYDVVDRSIPVTVMFDRAFMAIKAIKNDVSRHVIHYDDAMRQEAMWAQEITGQFEEAMNDGQIQPYLQPLVDSQAKVVGAEVLVRWDHPEYGLIPPVKFIPLFEENGRIGQLDSFMWEQACIILKEWESRGIDLFLSVNISPKDFYFLNVCETIVSLVEKHGIRKDKLRLEITESAMINDTDSRLKIIAALRKYGFLIEIDDFGSGYSSLNMLKDMPVDILKIDMMFLDKTEDETRARTILEMVLELSERLGIDSVTEGVETQAQFAFLHDKGCDLFQGYFFAKPMPRDDFEQTFLTED